MGSLIAVLLAITMAVFPISMPWAAALQGHGHVWPVAVLHEDAAAPAATLEHAADHDHAGIATYDPASVGGCEEQESSSHHGANPACCGMSMCHAFQVSTAALVSSPYCSSAPMALARDEQVGGALPGRLDRPPRNV